MEQSHKEIIKKRTEESADKFRKGNICKRLQEIYGKNFQEEYDFNISSLSWQNSGVKVLERNYYDKLRQSSAIGLVGYYNFTTLEETKIRNA